MSRRGSRGGKGRGKSGSGGESSSSPTHPSPPLRRASVDVTVTAGADTCEPSHSLSVSGTPPTARARSPAQRTPLAALAGVWRGRVYTPSAAAVAAVAGGSPASARSTSAGPSVGGAHPRLPGDCPTAPTVSPSRALSNTPATPPPPYPHGLSPDAECDGGRHRRRPVSSMCPVGLSIPPPLPPWASTAAAVAGGYAFSEAGMSCELLDFARHAALRPHECAQRAALLQLVECAAAALWPTVAELREGTGSSTCSPPATANATPTSAVVARDVALYGSYALGLSLPSSDIDVCVALGFQGRAYAASAESQGVASTTAIAPSLSCMPAAGSLGSAPGRDQHQLACLYDLAEHLQRHHGGSLRLEVYDQCRVPVIKLEELRTGVRADVSVAVRVPVVREVAGADPDVFETLPTERVLHRQQAWLRGRMPDPAAPALLRDTVPALATVLILVTKAALRQWGLNNLFTGGVCSAALYSLTHRYLQVRRHPRRPVSTCPDVSLVMPASVGGEHEEAFVEASCGLLSMSSPTASTVPGLSEDGHGATATTATTTITTATTTIAEDLSSSSSCRSSVVGSDAHLDSAGDEEAGTPSVLSASLRDAAAAARVSRVPSVLSASAEQQTSATCPASAVDELYAGCVERFGVSPARLLLNFWRYLSSDAFMFGYDVADAFASGNAAAAGTYDLTAPSFRIPELLALLRCTCAQLEDAILPLHGGGRAGTSATAVAAAVRRRGSAPSPLSLVLVDLRSLSCRA